MRRVWGIYMDAGDGRDVLFLNYDANDVERWVVVGGGCVGMARFMFPGFPRAREWRGVTGMTLRR